jgi:hypothetical protein
MNTKFIELWHSTHTKQNKKHWHSGDSDNSTLKSIPIELSINKLSLMKNPSDILNVILYYEINIGNNPLASIIRMIKYQDKEILVPDSCGKIIPSVNPDDQSFFIKIYETCKINSDKQGVLSNSSISLFCPSLGYQLFFIECKINHYKTNLKIGNYKADEIIYKIIPEKCIIAYPNHDKIDYTEIIF